MRGSFQPCDNSTNLHTTPFASIQRRWMSMLLVASRRTLLLLPALAWSTPLSPEESQLQSVPSPETELICRIGVTGATAGTLSFLVGGAGEGVALAQPLLSLMGQRIIHCGPSGAGLAAKICNNVGAGHHHGGCTLISSAACAWSRANCGC